MNFDRLIGSPVCAPHLELDEVLATLKDLGFDQFEAFTTWTSSKLDYTQPPSGASKTFENHGVRLVSFHLPPVKADSEDSLLEAVGAARFASQLGAEVVLYKADSRETYIRAAKPFLDAVEGLPITPVLQNHCGSPISSIADYRAVIEGIGDGRMKTLLEVGHIQQAGERWQDLLDLLGGSVALVHIKDMKDGACVPYGTGEVDFAELFGAMAERGYGGGYVVEMEGGDGPERLENTKKAVEYLKKLDV